MLAVLAVCGHPVPSRSQTACISIAVAEIANVVNNEWCNENCADNPNSELCEDKCHCPVVAINKPKETAQQSLGDCVSNDPAIDAKWCQENRVAPVPGQFNITFHGDAKLFWYSNRFADNFGLEQMKAVTTLLKKLDNMESLSNFFEIVWPTHWSQ